MERAWAAMLSPPLDNHPLGSEFQTGVGLDIPSMPGRRLFGMSGPEIFPGMPGRRLFGMSGPEITEREDIIDLSQSRPRFKTVLQVTLSGDVASFDIDV